MPQYSVHYLDEQGGAVSRIETISQVITKQVYQKPDLNSKPFPVVFRLWFVLSGPRAVRLESGILAGRGMWAIVKY